MFYVHPHFTSCNITPGAGSMVVITGENAPASALHSDSDGDGIFGLAKVSLYQTIGWKCTLLIARIRVAFVGGGLSAFACLFEKSTTLTHFWYQGRVWLIKQINVVFKLSYNVVFKNCLLAKISKYLFNSHITILTANQGRDPHKPLWKFLLNLLIIFQYSFRIQRQIGKLALNLWKNLRADFIYLHFNLHQWLVYKTSVISTSHVTILRTCWK